MISLFSLKTSHISCIVCRVEQSHKWIQLPSTTSNPHWLNIRTLHQWPLLYVLEQAHLKASWTNMQNKFIATTQLGCILPHKYTYIWKKCDKESRNNRVTSINPLHSIFPPLTTPWNREWWNRFLEAFQISRIPEREVGTAMRIASTAVTAWSFSAP